MPVLLIVACYLIGSIPVAWLMGKIVSGRDLRQTGSGNVGVLNTMISVSRWAGVTVFIAEGAKGVAAVLLSRAAGASDLVTGLAVLATISGTRWSIWLRGAGGRGNTAAMAALLVISWKSLLCALGIYFACRVLTRSSFIAARITLVTWPIAFGLITQSWWSLILGAVFSLLFATTHKPDTDDHLLLKDQWGGLRKFAVLPPRKR